VGEKHFTIDDHEMKILRAIDGKRTVRQLLTMTDGTMAKFRRMASGE